MPDDELYARAVMRHTDQVLALFVGERLINKIFGRVMQSHAMGRLVIAHFDWKAGVGPRPTLRWLQTQTGCGRTLAAFVGVAKVARLLSVELNPMDRREKFLVPGPRVVDGLRDWLVHHLVLAEMLDVMPPGCADNLQTDQSYFERYVRASLLVIEGIAQRRDAFPRWQWFEDHECGLRIAYAFLRAHCQGCLEAGSPVDAPVPLELTGGAVAQMLGLSKSHVRNVLNGAERLGILSHDGNRRGIRLSAPFLVEARASFMHLLDLMRQAHERAVRLPQAPDRPARTRYRSQEWSSSARL
ncbi:hypothetical protein WKR88_27555 [Trinickia caryophylli]|uniref:Uncharacterized protein n=1 Tax=Trinickia caryophylli TaxID=28094 RepID=A0A1X7HBJ1_TRICW|nr:hypothetical protein [Trinickia caryophylli]PMS13663.1 hypothetical protein C0Z17_01855 [Trinickia caryophylli]TRX14157.1 replication protein [Trinickia caryophylli]WQE13979.1 hypothetical protein U0034_25055 [Trinickia caryophylli]SMF83095.1 hypothetical protein SAMN06295900_12912 [Trinickia caryophylli]GLU33540.1 hypothetical protein Busp01_33820 [Trinickia caryophylli]